MIEKHFHALARRFGDLFQAVIRNDSVVVFEGNDVRNRCDSHYVEILFRFLSAAQSLYEFERNPRAAKVEKAFSCDFWVNHDTIGDSLLRLVVVGDDGIYSFRLQKLHFFNRSYARIYGDDEFGRVISEYSFERIDAYSVAVLVAVGNEIKHVEFVAKIQHKR